MFTVQKGGTQSISYCGQLKVRNMSFFNSLQQYVTTGVAQLGLSPRRSSRPDAPETSVPEPTPAPHPTTQLHGKYSQAEVT